MLLLNINITIIQDYFYGKAREKDKLFGFEV